MIKSKPFLITGHARSGTRFMATLLKELGYDVEHENYRGDGSVSYRHLAQHDRFGKKLHQIRHPLKILRSAAVLDPETQYKRCKELMMRNPGYTEPLEQIMWSWVNWCTAADAICDYRYKIEDLEDVYPTVFKELGLFPPNPLPGTPRNFNTWKEKDGYKNKVTWEDLYKVNPMLTDRVKGLANEYGYN